MQQGNESSTQRAVEIQIRADGESQSYSSRILQIDQEKAVLLSPMDETEVVPIRSGSEVILNFAGANGAVSETYRTIALDQIWGEEQEAWILTVTQPEEGEIRLRQYARHEETLQVNVQLLSQKQAFRAWSIDISGSGIQIAIDVEHGETIETGVELQLQFDIPGAGMDRELGVVGRAVRVWEGLLKGKAVLFSGIQFVKDYDDADEQALVRYVLKAGVKKAKYTIRRNAIPQKIDTKRQASGRAAINRKEKSKPSKRFFRNHFSNLVNRYDPA